MDIWRGIKTNERHIKSSAFRVNNGCLIVFMGNLAGSGE